jgi:DNA-directed RNA polymerase specialized sigma24 family protein
VRVSWKGGGGTVGAVTNSAVTARARTRRRVAGELTGRAERDARIAAAATQVAAAQDTIRGNADRRALAVAAAERAVADAERDERDANAAADQRVDAAVRQLRADGLTVAAIAELLHLSAGQVRRLVRRAHHAAGGGTAAAASAGAAAPEGRGAG